MADDRPRRGARSQPRSESGAKLTSLPDASQRLRVRAAWLYFVEGRTQSEIATILDVGRVTVVRLLADARKRREVRIQIEAPLAELIGVERALETRYGVERAIVAPHTASEGDPTQVIAAAAGAFISEMMRPGIQVGVGWGRTLYSSLPFTVGATLQDVRVVSLLGGIAEARRFNPAEFAWRFTELFQGEGFLVPAPALVDSPETRAALFERCGIAEVFAQVDGLDMVLFSAGGISTLNTAYRTGHVSEEERQSLIKAGAVGDILYNFVDVQGQVVDHPLNRRTVSADLGRLAKVPSRVLISGGADKIAVLKAALSSLRPTTFITDEVTANALAAD
ncbi:MAG: sugar-binding transcriptional regulator [Pseudomonadota bacterium]